MTYNVFSGTLNPTHSLTHAHTQPFYDPFSGATRVSWCQQKSFSGLCGARGDSRGRHTDHPAGHHSIRTNQRPTSILPPFYARCPSCSNPAHLSWLGTGTRYAGLHTQWLGYNSKTEQRKKCNIFQEMYIQCRQRIGST